MRETEAVRAHLNQLNIVCGAIFAGVAVFAGVVGYLLSSGAMPPKDMDLPPWLGTLLNALAFLFILKAYFLPRLFGSPAEVESEEEKMAAHKRNAIVGFALREGGAFLALVGALLTGEMLGAALMVGLAMLTMIQGWPRADQLNR